MPFLRRRIRPAKPADPAVIARAIGDLSSERFEVRQKAAEELEKLEDAAALALGKLLAGKPSLEVRRRAEQLLERLEGPALSPERLARTRGLGILEQVSTPEARRLLVELAEGLPEARLTLEAKASLQRLAKRPAVP